jgi:phosphoenolpyruvate-protein phosphotransferase (PTS system enzyme I)
MMLTGTIIAPGIAFGPAIVWLGEQESVPSQRIPSSSSIEIEKRRLEHAVRRAGRELEEVALRVEVSAGKSAADIFRAHAAMLKDPAFQSEIAREIIEEHWSAESAVSRVAHCYAQRLARSDSPYFAARAEDFTDLGRRLVAHLRKEGTRHIPRITKPSVLVVENLSAPDVLALDRTNLLALVIMHGGATSHASLLASTLGVPVVGGVPQLAGKVHNGETLIIDGNHGHILVDPTELALREYATRQQIFAGFRGQLDDLRDSPAETLDGRKVHLTVNIAILEEIPNALRQGAEGIGLLRTEYFFLSHARPPSEEEQYGFYTSVVKSLSPRQVTFRTYDLGADKMAGVIEIPEPNPMLGCRGIRVLREEPDQFMAQIRALLRASVHGPIRIMFPLITSLTEFQDTMSMVAKVKQRLKSEEIAFDPGVLFGCMVETPAAATIPDILASEAEFFSVGSNDLIQYTLAADRTNSRVSYVYEPLHLAVLRMMRNVIRAGHRRGRPVGLCGEMASDPIYTIILLGLGIDELSVNPAMVPAIKNIIRNVSISEAREIAHGVLRERRAKDVQTYIEHMMSSRFPQVMSVYGRTN